MSVLQHLEGKLLPKIERRLAHLSTLQDSLIATQNRYETNVFDRIKKCNIILVKTQKKNLFK